MKHMEPVAPRMADFAVENLKFYEQFYFCNGSEVNFLTKPRVHHGLLYLKACTIDLQLPSGEVIRAQPGDLLYLPKGCHYRSVFSHVSGRVPTVLFNCDLKLAGKDFALADSILRITMKRVNALDAIVEKASVVKDAPFALKSCFYALLELWREESTQGNVPARKHTLLAPAVEYLTAHADENVPVALLAQKCHLSESFFRKKFLEVYGVSPKTFILQKRLDRAKALLELGELNVNQVSELLGFSSPSYFSRIFHKKFGTPPVECLQK